MPRSVHDCERPDWLKRLGFRREVASVCSSIHLGALAHPNHNNGLVLLPRQGDLAPLAPILVVTNRQTTDWLPPRQDDWPR